MNSIRRITGPDSMLIKLAALVLPMYFVFYGPIHDKRADGKINPLWHFVFAGFAIYILVALLIIF